MDIKQKQQAMVKLAQVRLAINHVIRKRAMAKQAMTGDDQTDYSGFWGGLRALSPENRRRTREYGEEQQRQVEALPMNTPRIRNGKPRPTPPPGSPAAGNSNSRVGNSVNTPWQTQQGLVPPQNNQQRPNRARPWYQFW